MMNDVAQERKKPTAVAIIVAAGRGVRLGGDIPKQYRDLCGTSVLKRSVTRFSDHPAIDRVMVVVARNEDSRARKHLDGIDLVEIVHGGKSRAASVRAGLEALTDSLEDMDVVLIHDAARPFVSTQIISNAIETAAQVGGAVPVLPIVDSLGRLNEEGAISAGPDRAGLARTQTPQTFRFGSILNAHRRVTDDSHVTDDVAVALAAGVDVMQIPGSEENFKLTDAADFDRAMRALNASRETRTGFGFDVHRFAPGDSVRLCGVDIPHTKSLAGHSDADVGLHALTDALLGAIGTGDIGSHFPPSDPQWRGVDSARFLEHAHHLLTEKAGSVVNVDVTLICERPKIGPHRDAMRKRIAEILRVPMERVGVKATTTEGLGFTGRGEGIAANAVATISILAG